MSGQDGGKRCHMVQCSLVLRQEWNTGGNSEVHMGGEHITHLVLKNLAKLPSSDLDLRTRFTQSVRPHVQLRLGPPKCIGPNPGVRSGSGANMVLKGLQTRATATFTCHSPSFCYRKTAPDGSISTGAISLSFCFCTCLLATHHSD